MQHLSHRIFSKFLNRSQLLWHQHRQGCHNRRAPAIWQLHHPTSACSSEKHEKAKQGILLDQVKHSLQLSGTNFKATEQLISIYAKVKETLICLKATNTEMEKLRLRQETVACPTGNCCTKPSRLGSVFESTRLCAEKQVFKYRRKLSLLPSQVNMPLNIANSILKSHNEDAKLFKNQDNLN